ncbi:MAG: LPS export ABC transporter periplasmic protein LptC [Deltaproteobacteria bacterium]|nr:LPS export ABC transporter periplasmic protein LptC [Deltaproteobacteria bacterium]
MARLSKKLLPLTGILILLSVIGVFFFKSGPGESEKIIQERDIPNAGISSENFMVTERDPDKGTRLILKADEGSYSTEKDEEIGRFRGFRLKYQTKEAPDFELEGESGEIDRVKNEISLFGGLKGKIGDGYIIYTEQITIQQDKNLIKSDKAVTVEGPFFRITGKGLIMDLEKKTLEILKEVNSVFYKRSFDL